MQEKRSRKGSSKRNDRKACLLHTRRIHETESTRTAVPVPEGAGEDEASWGAVLSESCACWSSAIYSIHRSIPTRSSLLNPKTLNPKPLTGPSRSRSLCCKVAESEQKKQKTGQQGAGVENILNNGGVNIGVSKINCQH